MWIEAERAHPETVILLNTETGATVTPGPREGLSVFRYPGGEAVSVVRSYAEWRAALLAPASDDAMQLLAALWEAGSCESLRNDLIEEEQDETITPSGVASLRVLRSVAAMLGVSH